MARVPIDLHITAEAQTRLRELMAMIDDPRPVVGLFPDGGGVESRLGKDGGVVFERVAESGWSVGFYHSHQIPPEHEHLVQSISGIEFAFDNEQVANKLRGKTLSYVGGEFVVR